MTGKKTIIFFVVLMFLSEYFSCQKTASFRIQFETGSFKVSEQYRSALKNFLKIADTVSITDISIYGFCDDRGTIESNLLLSNKRATAVKEILLELNLNPQFISSAEGKGEIELTGNSVNGPVEIQRKYNRAVEIKITCTLKEKIIVAAKPKETEAVKTEPQNNFPSDTKGKLTENQKIGDKITLDNILFEGGEHFFLKESYPALEELGATMLKIKKYHILILGHVCCVQPGFDGTDFSTGERNLSVTRAKAVYDYLVKIGVDAKRLDYKGMKGDFRTGKGDKYDRRVEIEIVDIKEE